MLSKLLKRIQSQALVEESSPFLVKSLGVCPDFNCTDDGDSITVISSVV